MESVWTFSRKWQKRAPSGTDKSRLWSDPNEPSLRWGPIFLDWHLWEAHPRSALKNNFNLECAVASYCTSSYYNESLVGSDTHPRVHGLQFLKYLSCGEGGLLWALRVHTLGCWRWCWGIWDRRERGRGKELHQSWDYALSMFFCLKWGKSPGWSGHFLPNYSEKTWWKILSALLFRWTVSPAEMIILRHLIHKKPEYSLILHCRTLIQLP